VKTTVLLIAGSFYPREGGAERQMRSLLASVRSENGSAAVITQVLTPDIARRERVDNINIHRVGSGWAFRHAPRAAQIIFMGCAVVRAIRLNPRILVSLQMGTASASAAIAARLLRREHILRLTGGGTDRFCSEPVARAATPLGRTWSRLFARRSTTIVAPAHHLIRDFTNSFPTFDNPTKVITNGVVRPAEDILKSGEVIWYSRSGTERSQSTLAAIASLLPHVSFSVLGRGGAPEGPNLFALGWQDKPEPVIGRHRVLLNTSPSEGMPNTVLQALAWGVRIVGYDNAGMREVASRYPDAVRLVPQGDTEAAAKAIETCLSSPPLARQEVISIDEVGEMWREILKS